MDKIKIAIVDDHKLVSKALENMISFNSNFEVINTSFNGEEFLQYLRSSDELPDVALMDVNMPIKNGIETTCILSEEFPHLKVIALAMEDNENTIIKMLRAGAKGYLLKDMSPETLFSAINIVHEKGIFYTDIVSETLLKIRIEDKELTDLLQDVKDKELEFIKLACSEMTYKEIADQMCVSPRTIDGYRDSVFVKLHVKSRVGIVLYAIKHNLL